MKKKITGIVTILVVSVFILSGCGVSLQVLGSNLKLDLQNKSLTFKADAGLTGLETSSGEKNGSGDIHLDVQLDWQNKNVVCKVDTDSSGSGDGHMDFLLNWKTRDTLFRLDSEYPTTEEEKAAGASDINSLHFDLLLDWQKKNFDSNLNIGTFDLHVPLSEGVNNEEENGK